MKKILLLTCMLVTGICITSCSKDDIGGSSTKKLEGLWASNWYYNGKVEDVEFIRFSKNTIIFLDEYEDNCYYKDGYVYNCEESDLEEDGVAEYTYKDGYIWIGGVRWFKLTFIDNNSFKFNYANGEDGDEDEEIYYRVKGFKK